MIANSVAVFDGAISFAFVIALASWAADKAPAATNNSARNSGDGRAMGIRMRNVTISSRDESRAVAHFGSPCGPHR